MRSKVSSKGQIVLPAAFRRQDGIRNEQLFDIERIACLSWPAATGIRWARLLADLRSPGRSMPVGDSLIATTALEHGLVMVTRNVTDFVKADVEICNPFNLKAAFARVARRPALAFS